MWAKAKAPWLAWRQDRTADVAIVALGMIWEGGEQVWFAVEDAMDG